MGHPLCQGAGGYGSLRSHGAGTLRTSRGTPGPKHWPCHAHSADEDHGPEVGSRPSAGEEAPEAAVHLIPSGRFGGMGVLCPRLQGAPPEPGSHQGRGGEGAPGSRGRLLPAQPHA